VLVLEVNLLLLVAKVIETEEENVSVVEEAAILDVKSVRRLSISVGEAN